MHSPVEVRKKRTRKRQTSRVTQSATSSLPRERPETGEKTVSTRSRETIERPPITRRLME